MIIPALYLDRLVIEELYIRSKIECLQKCLQKRQCLSANFLRVDKPSPQICVLNSATIDEHYAVIGRPGDLYHGTDVIEWLYLELSH